MTKKEFKKKCKEEKTMSYKLMMLGNLFAVIGFIIVVMTFAMAKTFNSQIICFISGGTIAFIGMILDIIGEIKISKEFKSRK